jgi:cell division protein FtsI (penicillin-binding protein 3)
MSKGFANRRVVLLASLVFLSFGGLGTRLVWLQVLHRDQLLDSVDKARREIIVQSARRGDITDQGGNLLATSRTVFKVGVDPRSLRPQDEKNWPRLAELLGRPLAEVTQILTTRFRPAAAAASLPEGVGMAGRAAAGPLGLVFNLPGQPAAAPPSPPPGAAAPAVESDANDDTVVDEPDARGDQPIKYAKLDDSVPEATYLKIKELGIVGIVGDRTYRRDYPDNELAAHVLGYVNHDEKPVTGIEAFADFYLRGQDGWVETEKDGHQHELPQFRTRVVPASDGYSVKLSIDSYVQHVAEAELKMIAAKFQPIKATIVISDPRTGFVLALANYPTFDLNHYTLLTKEQQATMRNIAATDQYEPGSVFKIVAISGALNEGLVTPTTTFNCNLDRIMYTGAAPDTRGVVMDRTLVRSLPPDDDHFDHPIPVSEVVAHSSNRGTVQMAMMLKDQKFYDYARAFGFGERTGFPVGGGQEIVGDLRPIRKWDSLTITRMPMGQGVDATALQMHQAMGVIASGGVLLRPQVILEIRDASGALIFAPFRRAEVRRVIKESAARTMASLLTGVVTEKGATGVAAAIPGYDVAGKTGTTQKLLPITLASGKVMMHYSSSHHVSSFVGFFPARNPQIEISVFVDDADAHTPGGIGWGGQVAAPSFKNIALQLIPYLQIQPASALPAHAVLAMGGGRP